MFQVPAHAGDVDVELDLVAVRIGDVQAVRDGVVARADDGDAGFLTAPYGGAQLVVRVAHLEAEVVHAHVPPAGEIFGILPNLDEQQLMVGAAAAEERDRHVAERAVLRGTESLPTEHVAVKGGRTVDVVYVEDDVSQLLDLHARKLTRAATGETGGTVRRD